MVRPAPHLSLVLPAYNEADRIASTVETIRAFVEQEALQAELLVVDDGSKDATRTVAERALAESAGTLDGRVLGGGANRGKGHAVRTGLESARGRWVLMTDVDLAAPIEEYRRLAEALRDRGVDIAVGSRRVPGADVDYEQTGTRRLASALFNGAVRGMTGLKVRDTQCGFKLFDRERLQPVLQRMRVDGFAFDVELLFLARKLGLEIAEVPVAWKTDDRSHVRLLTDPGKMLWDVARMRWAWRRGAYTDV